VWADTANDGLAFLAKLLHYQPMLRITYSLHRYLRENVEHAYPEEACGILLGRRLETDEEVVRIIPCANVDPEPSRRYSIAPEELLRTQATAREEGLEILGFYHSHPDHSAEPSPTDLREAHWTGCVYVICGVDRGTLASVAAVRLAGPEQWEAERIHFEPPD
jgi:proteasome lid subunit RPN8/RPN11